MSKKNKIVLIVSISLIVVLLALYFVLPSSPKSETIKEVMKDGVLHNKNKVSLFGMSVNTSVISALVVSISLIVLALIVRIFIFPHFKQIPGKFQLVLEEVVGMFDKMVKNNKVRGVSFIGSYVFTAGVYIFTSTIFELFGFQIKTNGGASVSLSAPLSDINGAIALGFLSYFVILLGGLVFNRARGFFGALKDFSLPLSMSFRLFGALLSGALVTELVYYYSATSFVLPVIVGVMFTLIHAVIQAYVLVTLVSIFFGEASEMKKL